MGRHDGEIAAGRALQLQGDVVGFVFVDDLGFWGLGLFLGGKLFDVEHPVSGGGFPVAHFGATTNEPADAFEVVEEFFGFFVGELFFEEVNFDVLDWRGDVGNFANGTTGGWSWILIFHFERI